MLLAATTPRTILFGILLPGFHPAHKLQRMRLSLIVAPSIRTTSVFLAIFAIIQTIPRHST
jgi:hypothetical protein